MKFIKALTKHYAEEHQQHPVKFSWVNRDGDVLTELFSPVQCKEFITDATLWFNRNMKNQCIYSFTSSDQFRNDPYMRVTFPNKSSYNAFLTNIGMFGKIGWPSEIIYKDEGKAVVVQLDPEWMKTSWRVSLWSIIAKAAAWSPNKTEANFWEMSSNEKKHLSVCEVREPGLFKKIIDNVRNIPVFGYDELTSVNDAYSNHRNQGFWNTFVYRKGITGKTYEALLNLKGV